jgi:hypothetical protein
MAAWHDLWLWRTLDSLTSPNDRAVAVIVAQVMPDVERVVKEPGPKDFTLHDADHAARVAELMVDVMSEEVGEQLSAYELALLLLAAYLHDIGMAPQHALVAGHHRLLLTGDGSALSPDDRRAFQDWLDREHSGREPPVSDPDEADVLLGFYVRTKHVAWGERWVRANLAQRLVVPGYDAFADDLMRICRSHHEGYRSLAGEEFQPRFLQGGKAVVHRRYLACVLRVADVLEIDPERTPQVLLDHRDIVESSVVYWHKDHDIDLTIEDDGRVVAEARPSSAVVYRAVEETLNAIETELRLCRDLDATTPFTVAPRRVARTLPHRWRLEPIVYRDVRPRDDAFVYIDGAFRPDTQRLLELLAGQELYGNPLFALRELLQNAFDAVRERIAWQRLALSDPNDPSAVSRLVASHRVELTIERRGDGTDLLRCRDTGAGMNREILTNYLLVSGAGRHPEAAALARHARDVGFELERTGEFGIGVLSYFMLADRVELRTQRCGEAPSGEAEGWTFGTDGVGSFGELSRDTAWRGGTEVTLTLRFPLEAKTVAEALRRMVIRAPCEVILQADDARLLRLDAGWTATLPDLVQVVRNRLRGVLREDDEGADDEFLPRHDRVQLQRRIEALREAIEQLEERIRWISWEEELPGGLGRCRMALPYVETLAGMSLAIVNVQREDRGWQLNGIGLGRIVLFDFPVVHAVGGMRIREHADDDFPRHRTAAWITEVDWTPGDAGHVLVSRDEITLSRMAEEALAAVRRVAHERIVDVLLGQPASPLTRINACVARNAGVKDPPGLDSPWWLLWRPADDGGWWPCLEKLVPPIVTSNSSATDLQVGSQPITIPGYIGTGFADSFGTWDDRHQPPERYVLDVNRTALVGYWPDLVVRPAIGRDLFPTFPPGSHHVVGILLSSNGFAWNLSSPVCAGSWSRSRRSDFRRTSPSDPLVDRTPLRSPSAARRWIFELLAAYRRYDSWGGDDTKEIWDAVSQRDPEFLRAVIQLAMDDETATELLIIDDEYDWGSCRTVSFSPAGVKVTGDGDLGEEVRRLWSQPGWCVERCAEAPRAKA